MRSATAFATLGVLGLLVFKAAAAGGENMTWRVEGQTRRAIVYAPSRGNGKAPLIFSFHGAGDDVENFQYTGIHRAYSEAIVVYFQGAARQGSGFPGWQTEKGQDNDRDLKLVDAALASLREKFKVDDTRVYATGFSNGAGLTYLLWAERPNVFAAYAPVAARLRPSVLPTQPKPLFHIAGTRDPQIVFSAQKEAMETAMKVDGVVGKGSSCGDGCTVYGKSTATPVMTWIHEGGHVWPDSTSDRIAKFFRDHPLKP